MRMAWLS